MVWSIEPAGEPLIFLFLLSGIDPQCKLFLRELSTAASFLQSDDRILAKGKRLLFPVKSICQPPELPAGWLHKQKSPPPSLSLVGFEEEQAFLQEVSVRGMCWYFFAEYPNHQHKYQQNCRMSYYLAGLSDTKLGAVKS